MGLRRSFWFPFFGVPRGRLGSVGARLMPSLVGPLYTMMAGQLGLREPSPMPRMVGRLRREVSPVRDGV